MHLKKDITFARLLAWDKGTNIDIHQADVRLHFCSLTSKFCCGVEEDMRIALFAFFHSQDGLFFAAVQNGLSTTPWPMTNTYEFCFLLFCCEIVAIHNGTHPTTCLARRSCSNTVQTGVISQLCISVLTACRSMSLAQSCLCHPWRAWTA